MKKFIFSALLFLGLSFPAKAELTKDDFNLTSPKEQVRSTVDDIDVIRQKLSEIQIKLKALERVLPDDKVISKPKIVAKAPRANGTKKKAKDGGPDWTWNAKKKVWYRYEDVEETCYRPSYSMPMPMMGGGGFGGFGGGGGGCAGGG